MSELMWVRSHVRQLLADEWGSDWVQLDGDGDVLFRYGSAGGWVTVIDSDPVMVRVLALAACGVKRSAKLFRWLNETQRSLLSARIEVCHDVVLVVQTISPVELTAPVLVQAVQSVSTVADEIGPLVAALADGFTPFDADADEDVDAP